MKNPLKISEEQAFLTKLNARARQMADEVAEGDTSAAFAALDLLTSIHSGVSGGISSDELTTSYPVKHWREQQISVPIALLRPVVEGWFRYRWGDDQPSLEQALGVAANTKGASPERKNQLKKDRDRRLSNSVVVDLVASCAEGAPVSQDAACAKVAEDENVSLRIVERAFRKHGIGTVEKLKLRGIIEDG